MVELCRDRVGLMLNPEGPKGAQLWNTRRVIISGLPSQEGWPKESQVLSGTTRNWCSACVREIFEGFDPQKAIMQHNIDHGPSSRLRIKSPGFGVPKLHSPQCMAARPAPKILGCQTCPKP